LPEELSLSYYDSPDTTCLYLWDHSTSGRIVLQEAWCGNDYTTTYRLDEG
jgi:hypothetical protein